MAAAGSMNPVATSSQARARVYSKPSKKARTHLNVQRVNNPKTFGAIPGVPVGARWESREECSIAAVHAPWVAGISGTVAGGAYSIALSGGYPDDVDMGYTFTYTGAVFKAMDGFIGGRNLKGRPAARKSLRVAPQSWDQTFEHAMNAALKKSAETKKPVRVIRGFNLDSIYAPRYGYRYDGLYVVEKAWMERGKEGYKVCRYQFNRIPGQALLPGTKSEPALKVPT